jgi:hypothetical protein
VFEEYRKRYDFDAEKVLAQFSEQLSIQN